MREPLCQLECARVPNPLGRCCSSSTCGPSADRCTSSAWSLLLPSLLRPLTVIERAAHGELELHASSVLVLALQLVCQIPGFVVGSVVNLHEMCSALKGDPNLAGHELAGNVRCRQWGYAVDGPVPPYIDN